MSSEKVSCMQRHEPALQDGEYTIEVTQDVSLLGEESGGLPTNLTETVSKTIYVAGERFSIGSKNIFKQFPPPNNTGDYSNVLPHIVLTRSTLPWERSTGDGGSTPWMYLFVYDDDDLLLLKQTYLGDAWAERPVIAVRSISQYSETHLVNT